MKQIGNLLLLLIFPTLLFGQIDSTKSKLSFQGDFRFRVEQDWSSRKSDGTYRNDRTRLRYRARFGVEYQYKDWLSFGARLRTGDPKKQQDPQLTLGDSFKEFGTLPISFEKIYVKFNHKWFSSWLGKNAFPFEKQNELFWSDNVFPEGISLSGSFNLEGNFINALQVNTGHFIVASNGSSLDKDASFQGIQVVTTHLQKRLKLFPSFYYFNNIPNIPDGNETFVMDYAILHIGAKFIIVPEKQITAGFDFYQNVKNYDNNPTISKEISNQKQGMITSLSFGNLKKSGDWKLNFTYSFLEKFAAVDFFAQNDWARWDYSSQGSNDGRLTNFKGLEVMGGYAINQSMNLKLRAFFVNQIVPLGIEKENGNRVRLDFNIKF
ncbi:putative porin [Polaribacter sp. NJDZ03]|uniref:putative porin n=1 Tax=Polaribacter sp. NJDZ03 TaxID=2855841 RepID=UPI001C4A629F|nr:putative porin [Polaribacter sp. NJDZ03]